MSKLTALEVSRTWKVSRSSVYNKMDSGVLAFETNSEGVKIIDSSEAARVFDSSVGRPIESNKDSLDYMTEQLLESKNDLIIELKKTIDRQENMIEQQRIQLGQWFRQLRHEQGHKGGS